MITDTCKDCDCTEGIEKHASRYTSLFAYRKRSPTTEYPREPLKNNIPQSFVVTKFRRPNCGLFDGNTKRTAKYMILKIANEFDDIYTNFYAIQGPEFTRIRDVTNVDDEGDYEKRYSNQIGFAKCQPGWIDQVWVNNAEDLRSDVEINARRCGIGSVLTQLCLKDPTLNQVHYDNMALQQLNVLDTDGTQVNRIERTCENFVGLHMSAEPKDAACGYFSAAIREHYLQIMIQERYHGTAPIHSFNVYKTKLAKENYNVETGTIAPCNQNAKVCQAFDGLWYFCKEKDGDSSRTL